MNDGSIGDALSCSICREPFNTAMMLPECSHNFCSLCIRRWLIKNPCCPVCRTGAKTSQLVNNKQLDDIIDISRNIPIRSRTPRELSSGRTAPVVYNLLSDSKLKTLLESTGLQVTGTRKEWIKKHKELVLRLNANSDSSSPSTRDTIVKQVNSEFSKKPINKFFQKQVESKTPSAEVVGSSFKKLIQDYKKRRLDVKKQESREGDQEWDRVWSEKVGCYFYYNNHTGVGQFSVPME